MHTPVSLRTLLDSPGDTGGSLLYSGNNFHKRLRVALEFPIRPQQVNVGQGQEQGRRPDQVRRQQQGAGGAAIQELE